ncbi:MAG: RES family NAD+ phosphorylase [Cellvibrionaceae bacterium]|nr:RES family NAD+ phosphorylase [Cellvibrionaceae bacterium]
MSTPFRYPPLAYGSRFGSTLERGIFYASQELATAFAESAVTAKPRVSVENNKAEQR